ncbi:hypothetical protein [Geodermatophilus sp. CPCC 206100]|uniref:hypothetical protein n=1 Tax=Geodermatophilus sp. CPCC 206100 TaxID=3020054 RepID=UPI003B001E70
MDPAATRTTTPAPPARRLLPAMRVLLAAFSLLTALAVVTLFVLAEQTDQTFAWTIQPPLTAAFLGAGYASGCVLVVLSLRDGVWARTRVPLLTILVFVVITLAATLLHLDRFHFAAEFADRPLIAQAAAWFWLTVYVVVPLGMLALLLPQERAAGSDPPATHPVPRVLRGLLGAESVVLTGVGAVLFAAPAAASTLWPWPLTPLTSRAVAAWLVAFGVATALAAVAGDLERLRTASIAYTVFGVLVAVAVARFADTVEWGDPAAWVLVVMVVAVIGTGAAGWRLAPAPVRGRHG